MLKIVGKHWKRTGYFCISNYLFPPKIVIDSKGENSSIMGIGDTTIIKWSGLNKTYQYHVPFDMIHLQGHSISMTFLPKMHTLHLIMKKKMRQMQR